MKNNIKKSRIESWKRFIFYKNFIKSKMGDLSFH